MNNLANIDLEQVETLPSHDKVRRTDAWHRYGKDFPRRKIQRFLLSRQGKLWDNVFSEYVHLEWVPKQYKTEAEISTFVYLHTFMEDGKVWFHDKFMDGARLVDDFKYGSDCFYRHPETKKLCYHRKVKVDYAKRHKEEVAQYMRILGDYHQLLKVAGIWYEVKGELIKSETIEIDGLHYRPAGVTPVYRTWRHKDVPDIAPPDGRHYKIINGKLYAPYAEARYEGKPLGPKECLLEDLTKKEHYWNRHNYGSVKIVVCRQLSSKDLKKHGLKNDRKLMAGVRCKKCGGIAGDTCIYHICPMCSKYREDCKCFGVRRF